MGRVKLNDDDYSLVAEGLGRLGINVFPRTQRWLKALRTWASAGYPTRTQTEVAAIVAMCQACENYVDGRCKKCGCCVNKSRVAVVNKAKMATEHCPVGQW